MSSAPVHVQACTLRQVSVDTSVHICEHTLRRVCTCAHVCAVCSLVLGEEGEGVQLVYVEHSLHVWKLIFDRRRNRGVSLHLL